jgi:dihydropteroate synthase
MVRTSFPLPWGSRTFVMGIINVTPDSFSGDGLLEVESSKPTMIQTAIEQARRFAHAGADILDIGGESTRPGARSVSAEEELERVLPVVTALKREDLDVYLSLDSYKAEVAETILKIAPVWVNDVWGLRMDARLGEVAARYKSPIILMHNRSRPANAEVQSRLGGRYIGMHYTDLLAEVNKELMESVALARDAGVENYQIILDPGIGFGKTVEQNLELINHLDEIRALGFPVLLGASRKSFIGYTLNLPPDQRMEGTAATATVGIVRGADILRVHDVAPLVRVARMTDAIVRKSN